MKILLLLVALFSLGFVSINPSSPKSLYRAKDADEAYAKRESEHLNTKELKAVGMWSGENKEVKWEMLRSDDGIYELVLHEEYQGTLHKDYIKGVWGINGDQYYYRDLETNNDLGFYPATYETVIKSTMNEFRYKSESEDGSVRISVEKRVDEFKFDLWKKYSKRAIQSGDDNSE
jgi:hypothetical protein